MITSFDDVFQVINYPSGEFHVKIKEPLPPNHCTIVSNIVDFNGLMKCIIGNTILYNNGLDASWVIPFFPFARDDRRNSLLESSELQGALAMCNELAPICVDAHSDVTTATIRQFPQSEVVLQYMIETDLFEDEPIVAIPDAGAAKKIDTWLHKYHALTTVPLEAVQCLKKRDTITGKLSGFQIVDPEKVRNRNVVIIDDICDGGGTFIGLAKELSEAGAERLRLGVTHGLFTKGLTPLSVFEKIYTLDSSLSFGTNNHLLYGDENRLQTVSLNKIIERGNYV